LMLLTLLLPLLIAMLIVILTARGLRIGRFYACLASSTALSLSLIMMLLSVLRGIPAYEGYGWIRMGGLIVGFDLFLDWLNLPLAFAIASLCLVSSVYSFEYMKDKHDIELYYALLLFYAVGMLGVTLSTNLIQFFLFFEAMNIPAYFLVSLWGTRKARVIGVKYILYMVAGGLCLLAGILWFYSLTGTLDLNPPRGLLNGVDAFSARVIAFLMFVGFAVKMGVFPFHSWLPDFHGEAPVPIHALLSAVMIKLGAYGLIRVVFTFFPSVIKGWSPALSVLALITMFWGALMALVQRDFKRVLAYSSVNQMGYILLGISSLTPIGVVGGLYHMLTHGVAKGSLLYCAGSLVHSAGTKYIDKLGGLAWKMPITATVALIGALSIAGTPPLGGFASELMLFTGTFEAGFHLVCLLGLASTALTAAYYLWTVRRMFFGERAWGLDELYERYVKRIEIPDEGVPRPFEMVSESPLVMVVPMMLIALFVTLLGVFPHLFLPPFKLAADAILALMGGTP